MAITTLAQVLSGMQQPQAYVRRHAGLSSSALSFYGTFWNDTTSAQPAGAYDTTLNGVTLTAPVTGAIPWSDPPSGTGYLARLSLSPTTAVGGLIVCDRLWHNGGFTITSTGAQSITSPTWPARDEDGATDGKGVFLALEVSATVGAAAPTVSISYTNSAGTSGRTGANILPTYNSAQKDCVFPIGLQQGDLGVRSVQSLTLSASWISGTINLVAYRVVAVMPPSIAGTANILDAITGCLPKIQNGSVLYLMSQNVNDGSARRVGGELAYTFG